MSTGLPTRNSLPSLKLRTLLVGLSVLLLLCVEPLAARQRTLEQAEAALAVEKDPRKRAHLALQILDLRFAALRAFVATGTMIGEDNTVLPPYEAALEQLEQAARAAAHAGTWKRVEVGLRRHMKDLEQVRQNVSVMERPLIEAVAARVEKAREAVLYAIMAPKKKS